MMLQPQLDPPVMPLDTPVYEKDDPAVAAKQAGLRYVHDSMPGIQRKKAGKHFRYLGTDGQPVTNLKEIERITKLGIPPAWTEVWICTRPNGHIQATGRDAKGRKQYRYHDRWRTVRDETKYTRMIAFGEVLPQIRAQTTKDLAKHGLSRERVLATVVQLLDATAIRIGNEEYAKENASFGLTTLHNEHVDVTGQKMHFHFKGKSGKVHIIELKDQRLAKIIKKLQDLPGQEIFQFVDDAGETHSIESDDVNDYLHALTHQDFTAKDFRTWTGTVCAAEALKELGVFDSPTQAKKNISDAIKQAAAKLGNTPAICRKSYVHPGILGAYLNGTLTTPLTEDVAQPAPDHGLRPQEAEVLDLLKKLEQANEGQQGAA